MINPILRNASLIVAQLTIPGLGFSLLGHQWLAWLQLLSFTVLFKLATVAGLIYVPAGLVWLVITFHILNVTLLLYFLLRSSISFSKIRWVSGLVYSVVAFFVFFVLFTYRTMLFGLNFYIIPSQSMAPLLSPGDIILVDLTDQKPTSANAWVYYYNDQPTIKRIKYISPEGVWFVGDNASQSIDSRHYGLVTHNLLIGRARLTLFNANQLTWSLVPL